MSVSHALSATTPDDPTYEIRPSHWNEAHVQAYTILGNTAGASTVSGTNVVLSAGPNATISVNGSTLVFSGGAGAAGNTGYLSANGVTASLGTVEFANGNGVTWGIDAQTVTASVETNYLTTAALSNHSHGNPTLALTNLTGTTASASNGLTLSLSAAAPQTGISGVIVSDATYTSGTLSFSNQNGVTIGSSVNGASQYVRLSVATSYAASNHSHGNPTLALTNLSGTTASNSAGLTLSLSAADAGGAQTAISGLVASDATYTSGTVYLSNQNGVTIGSSVDGASQYARFSVATSYAASNHSHGNPTLALTNLTGTTASASNGLTLSLSAAAPFVAGVSTGGNTAGDTGVTGTRVVLVGSNAMTLSQATGAAGATVTLLPATTFRASNDAVGLNTAQTNVTWTVNSAGLSLNAGGYAGTASGFTGANISATITHNTAGLSLSMSVAAPGAAAENNAINLLGANTAGNTTATGSTIGWSGVNLTLSGTNNSQVVVSAPATSSLVGASGITVSTNGSTISVGRQIGSYFGNMNGEWFNSIAMQFLQSTSHIQPFVLEGPLSFGQIRIPMSLAMAASSTGATTGNSQFSYGFTRSHNFVLYSRGTGASSMSLQSVASTQLTDRQSINVSAAANSTQFSYTNRATYQMSTGTVGFTFDYSSSAASLNFHTSGMTANTGLKQMEFQWATSLSPGQYWLMYGISSSTQSQYTAQGTRLFNIMTIWGASQPNLAFGTIGAATNSSVGLLLGNGSFTTAGGGTTASLPISAVTTTGSHNKPVFQLFHIA